MAKCYILASISNILQHQMQDVGLASDIMLSLKEMFGEQGHSTRQETMRQIYNTKMAEVTLVREHCLKMISNLNTLEVLGVNIDGESHCFATIVERLHNPKILGIIRKESTLKGKYHIIRDIVAWGDVVVAKIDSVNNLVDSFTKASP